MRRKQGRGARQGRAAAAGLLAGCLVAAAGGCAGSAAARPAAPVSFPEARFAVIADPHIFDTSSSSPGPAWDLALGSGIKLLAEASGILDAAIDAIAAEQPDFVLVCGDITKDGERSSHQLAARQLACLAAGRPGSPGPRVLVVPGNHDVANPRAARYRAGAAEAVPSVSPGEFASIYAEAGYADAASRDPGSLSYAAEPVPGLCVLAIDTCRYEDNRGHPVTAGRVRPATLAWLRGVLAGARARGAAVVAFMHHGLAPHFPDQRALDPSRIASGADPLARLLADAGARIVFTGHGHAQDAVPAGPPGRGLLDIETGSLVTFPNPWRLVTLHADGTLRIESRFVTTVPSRASGFPEYSRGRLRDGIRGVLAWSLGRAGVREADADSLAGQAVDAVEMFYRGDEQAGEVALDTGGMCGWGAFVGKALEGPLTRMANDLPPPDNALVVDLAAPPAGPAPPALPAPGGGRR